MNLVFHCTLFPSVTHYFIVKVSRIPSKEIIPEAVAPLSNQVKTDGVLQLHFNPFHTNVPLIL